MALILLGVLIVFTV